MLIDIQHTFDMEIRNDGFVKYFKKIFKKKLKIPKLKSDDAEGNAIIIHFINLIICIYLIVALNIIYISNQFS